MNKLKTKIIKPDLLTTNERCDETYRELYNLILLETQEYLEKRFAEFNANYTYDTTMGSWLFNDGGDGSVEPIRKGKIVPGSAWAVITQGTKRDRAKHKAEVIKKWKAEAIEKDNRVLHSTPFFDVSCSDCPSKMKYDWSIIYDRGVPPDLDEQVLHVYICPKCQARDAIFEDSIRWVTNSVNRCPLCQAKRTTLVTKDDCGKTYFIHGCIRCDGKQVEKEDKYG